MLWSYTAKPDSVCVCKCACTSVRARVYVRECVNSSITTTREWRKSTLQMRISSESQQLIKTCFPPAEEGEMTTALPLRAINK